MYHVYILQTLATPHHYYTGFTEDPDNRIRHHNEGGNPHTAKYRPWRIKTLISFSDRDSALAFERHLKSASGRAFAKKRL
jgi:predicted GIY-YIG superfamily endonuclease